MNKFWRLISVYISLAAFLVTGVMLLTKGENLFYTVIKSIAVFFVLYVVQCLLGTMLVAVTGTDACKQVLKQDDHQNQN